VSQYETILSHLPIATLVVFRVGGLMLMGPVFGSPAIPVRVKVMLSALIGVAVYPALLAGPLADAVTTTPLDLFALGPLVAVELLIGLIVGYLASLPLTAVQTGGLVIGQQMGLGFARFYNPGIDDEADIVGQLLFFLALAGFLAIGGHDALVLAILRSFEHVPLGAFVIDGQLLDLMLGLLLSALELALRVAAPVLAVVFMQSVAMGFMAKTVPQLNILSLGFVLRILVGFGMVMLGLQVIDDVLMDEVETVISAIMEWLGP
jgi:flagellar biosynthetic protein FliR